MDILLQLQEKRDEAKGTKTFIFAKPEGFEYVAGQYCYVTLPELKYEDKRGPVRHFTLSSSPTEDFISITVRIREESGYKKTLDELPIGAELTFKEPQGDFCLTDPSTDSGQQVMIAGGIGITPYRSIIKYVTDKNLSIPIHLVYSNSLPEEIAFRRELETLSASHPNIKVSMTVSKPEESKEPWTGLTGRIDDKLIQKLTTEYRNPVYWLCGPPPMVTALEEEFEKLKIPQSQIKVEKFTGY